MKISNEVVMRFNPLMAPILHRIDVVCHYYFVPFRILDENWEDFITGGKNGDNAYALPRYNFTGSSNAPRYAKIPYGIILAFLREMEPPMMVVRLVFYLLSYPWWAYNTIYNEYYRDENLQVESDKNEYYIKRRNWEKDYFTSSLPFQQRGTSPALPITGTTYAEFENSVVPDAGATVTGAQVQIGTYMSSPYLLGGNLVNNDHIRNALNRNTIDLSQATTFDVNDLRLAFQIQKWMERNARAGVRYTEFLKAHFGVNPRDDRLQRPEYIGGTKNPVIISEVLQTSSTDAVSPQGNLAGHGISVQSGFAGSYHVQEYGLIMGIMSVMPKPMYCQGINRQWLRETRYDFYFREFANLSEQAVLRGEVYNVPGTTPVASKTVFGFQGRYDEMRVKQNIITSDFRDTFSYWHIGRVFSNPPVLNTEFIQCGPRKDIFAVPTEPAFLCNFGNIVKLTGQCL